MKVGGVRTSLSSSLFFIPQTTTSITFHVYHWVQHYECLKMFSIIFICTVHFIFSMIADFSTHFRVWPFGTAINIFALRCGLTARCTALFVWTILRLKCPSYHGGLGTMTLKTRYMPTVCFVPQSLNVSVYVTTTYSRDCRLREIHTVWWVGLPPLLWAGWNNMGVRAKDRLGEEMFIHFVQGLDGYIAMKSRDHI